MVREDTRNQQQDKKQKQLFETVKCCGKLAICSGHGPLQDGIPPYVGAVGRERTVADGQEAARLCVLNALQSLENHLGTLDAIDEILSLRGFVNGSPDFLQQSSVMNAASELLLERFGKRGTHVRSAIGVASLPRCLEDSLWRSS